jgi:hypothetical protein
MQLNRRGLKVRLTTCRALSISPYQLLVDATAGETRLQDVWQRVAAR